MNNNNFQEMFENIINGKKPKKEDNPLIRKIKEMQSDISKLVNKE